VRILGRCVGEVELGKKVEMERSEGSGVVGVDA
jgi:hypothetical protein